VNTLRRLTLSTAMLGIAIVIGATPPAACAQSPKRGGSVSLALEADVTGIDPVNITSYNDKQVGITVYDTLLEVDARGTLQPNLAERFEAAPDATSFRLHLRRGVKFHDDTPFDAAAVVEHFKRLMDPKTRYRWASDLAGIASIDATGPLEVTIRMKSPSAHFLAVLADTSGMVVSPTAVRKHGENYAANPVGTGPFVFKEWRRGSQITFVRNTAWWKGPVHLDEVVYRPMPDTDTRIASLKAGNLDIAMNAPGKDVLEAKNSKKFTVLDPGSLATTFVMLNVDKPDVSDQRVRQAMAHALDRDALNKVVNKGLLKVASTAFGTGLPPHERVEGYPKFDPARAKKLLADYGKPVKIRIATQNAPLPMLTSQAMQQMWKKVGIESEIVPFEQTALIRAANSRDFQVMLYRWQGGVDPDRNVYIFFHSKGSANRTGLNNPEMDRLLEAGRGTMDPAQRLQAYTAINNLLARELPYLFLTYFNNYSLAQTNVKGVAAIPDGLIRVGEVWKER
jgi:peptide/nickel transport system substrate-binding protein